MKQPRGFAEEGKQNMVCRLRRSIYGLKQSARWWNQLLHSVLVDLGFTQSEVDQCLYTRVVDGIRVCLLVYVDDILIGCKDGRRLDEICRALMRKFDITDLGQPAYFLGMEIACKNGRYSISLERYIKKIAARFGQHDAKPSKSPMDTGFVTTKDTTGPFPNTTVYRSLVGALLYVLVQISL